MSKALTTTSGKRSALRGVLPAVASGIVPGLGQLINGEGSKAIGVFAVATVAGLGLWSALPVVGTVAGAVAAGTWIYGVVDGYFRGRRPSR
jgi:TM2 domain-containing membrane protein YozV